jgi:hypothetical protein
MGSNRIIRDSCKGHSGSNHCGEQRAAWGNTRHPEVRISDNRPRHRVLGQPQVELFLNATRRVPAWAPNSCAETVLCLVRLATRRANCRANAAAISCQCVRDPCTSSGWRRSII